MRKKLAVAAMANEYNSEATQAPQPCSVEKLQIDDVARLAKRLYPVASGVAQALLPIVHLQIDPGTIRELVHRVYALAAVLSTLLDDLTLERVSRGGTQNKDMWTKEHHKNLKRSLEECHGVFLGIARAFRLADEHHHVTGLRTGEDYIDQFHFDNEPEAQNAVHECFILVSQTKLIVKRSCLARFENLNTKEVQEALRLTQALQQPDFDAVWALRDEVFASQRVRALLTPTYPAATLSTNLPGIGTLSSPHDLVLDNHTKPIWAYGDWPPTGVYSSHSTPVSIPPMGPYAPTSKQNQVPNHSEESAVTTDTIPKVKREVVTFREPSVIKPHASKKSLLGKDASSDVCANWQTPNINAFNPTPHLEAYSIHPLVETTNLVSKLSYNLESLRLGEGVLKAQVQSLDSDYSVMDVLLDLQPQLLNLIQSRAAQRQGNIVSVKHGKAFDLSTAMGLFQVKPVVFIISTTTMLPQDSATIPAQLTNPANSFFKPATGQGTFGNLAATPDLICNKGNIIESHLSSPEAYSRHLQEQGELCTYVEANEAQSLQHYQTITTDQKWHNQDRSLEEIRLADYRAGRQGMVRTKAVLSPWESAPVCGAPVSNRPSQPALPATTEYSKTAWFPATTLPFTSGHALDRAPSKDSPSTLDANTSPEHLLEVLMTPGPSQGSIAIPSPLAPTLPQQGQPSTVLCPPSSNAWDARVSSRASSDQQNTNPFSGGPKTESSPINKHDRSFSLATQRDPQGIQSNPAIGAKPAYETTTNSGGICTRHHHHHHRLSSQTPTPT